MLISFICHPELEATEEVQCMGVTMTSIVNMFIRVILVPEGVVTSQEKSAFMVILDLSGFKRRQNECMYQ